MVFREALIMFAFVVYPRGVPSESKVFFHTLTREIAGFEPEYLEKEIVQRLFSLDYHVEDMEFLEVGKYMPITFEKTVSYTLNQD